MNKMDLPSNGDFWKNKRVLVTGHTGFKGSWLSLWLNELGAQVTGDQPRTKYKSKPFRKLNISDKLKSHFIQDIRNEKYRRLLIKAALK